MTLSEKNFSGSNNLKDHLEILLNHLEEGRIKKPKSLTTVLPTQSLEKKQLVNELLAGSLRNADRSLVKSGQILTDLQILFNATLSNKEIQMTGSSYLRVVSKSKNTMHLGYACKNLLDSFVGLDLSENRQMDCVLILKKEDYLKKWKIADYFGYDVFFKRFRFGLTNQFHFVSKYLLDLDDIDAFYKDFRKQHPDFDSQSHNSFDISSMHVKFF